MNARDERVLSQDQRFAAEFDDRCVVFEVPRLWSGCERPQRCDELRLVQRPAAFATASSTPLTNFASRSSKNAFATSTYSLIAVAFVTSWRASSS